LIFSSFPVLAGSGAVNKRCFLTVVLGVCLTLSVGCHRPPDKPSRFNNLMGQTQADMRYTADTFRQTVNQIKGGSWLSGGQVRGPYNTMEKEFQKAKKMWEDMWPPKDSETGEALLDAYRNYMDQEEKILQKAHQIVTIVEENDSSARKVDAKGNAIPKLDPAQQWELINPLLNEMDDMESTALGPVLSKQKDFCKAHNLNLVNPSDLGKKKKDD
jgi:hypothetical protein